MATEIERKFLVLNDAWRASVTAAERYRQGYLAKTPLATVRIRCAEGGAALTIKTPRKGAVRDEFSVALPLAAAEEMLRTQCLGRVIEKVRHFVAFDGMMWHVDVFAGHTEGLTLAEIELDRCDRTFRRPPWVGAEVTEDPRYHNSTLALGAQPGPVAVSRRRRALEGVSAVKRGAPIVSPPDTLPPTP